MPKARETAATDSPRSSHSTTEARVQSGAGESATTARRTRRSSEAKKERKKPLLREIADPKCKAHSQNYTRPWFPGFLADALQSADIAGACARAEVTLLDLHRLRAQDPAADAACLELDQLAALLARQAVVYAAASGDLRAIRALTDGSLSRICADADGPPPSGANPPTRGGAWVLCPHCNSTLLVTGALDSYSQALRLDAVHPRDVAHRVVQDDIFCPPVPPLLIEYYQLEAWSGGPTNLPREQPRCPDSAEATTADRPPPISNIMAISR